MAFTGGTATIPRDKSHSLVDRWFGNVGLFGKISRDVSTGQSNLFPIVIFTFGYDRCNDCTDEPYSSVGERIPPTSRHTI